MSNRPGGGYKQGDATIETGSSSRDTSTAWHTARDDYEQDQGLDDRHGGGWKK